MYTGASVSSGLDSASGHHQIDVVSGDQHKFVLSPGLANGPSVKDLRENPTMLWYVLPTRRYLTASMSGVLARRLKLKESKRLFWKDARALGRQRRETQAVIEGARILSTGFTSRAYSTSEGLTM